MATVYVRIPRNRWTPIGEIDLDGYGSLLHTPTVSIIPEYLAAIKKSRRLRARELEYVKKSMRPGKAGKRYRKRLDELYQEIERVSVRRLLIRSKPKLGRLISES